MVSQWYCVVSTEGMAEEGSECKENVLRRFWFYEKPKAGFILKF